MKEKVRILHVMYGVDSGGVEAVVYNYYYHMDRTKYQFDIVSQNEKGRDISCDLFAAMFRKLGSKVYYIPSKQENLYSCITQFIYILKNEKYDILHIHMGFGSLPYVVAAKLCGMRNIIVHNHIAFDRTGWSTRKSTKIMGVLLKFLKTKKMACSRAAANEAWPDEKVFVLNNAVDVEQYNYDEQKRAQIRDKLDIKGHAVCAVARFTESKNHSFLIDIFQEYLNYDNEAKLVLVGTGEKESEIRKKVKEAGFAQSVLFLGSRDDVPDLLQAMDVFVLPSKFEGFGIVYVEAQLAGLPTFAVKGAVSEEIVISDKFHLIPADKTAVQWAKEIAQVDLTRKSDPQAIYRAKEKCFDICLESIKLEALYLEILESKE